MQNLNAQVKRMGYKALADKLYYSKKEDLIFEDYYFFNDLPDRGTESFQSDYNFDNRPTTIEGGFQNYLKQTTSAQEWHISAKEISFINCSFESDLRIANTTIDGNLNFFYCSFDNISGDYVWSGIPDEKYGGSVFLDSIQLKGSLNFWDITVKNSDLLTDRKRYFIKLNNSKLLGEANFVIPRYTFESKNSEIHHLFINSNEGKSIFRFNNTKIKSLELNIMMAEKFSLENSVWGSKELKDTFIKINITSDYLTLDKNKFISPMNFHFGEISKFLWLNNNKYNSAPSLYFTKIPFDSNIDLLSLNGFNFNIYGRYSATQKQLANPEYSSVYKDYVRVNKLLYDYFKVVGDRGMANLAYIKVKDIETALLKYKYYETGNFNTLFAWQLNNLLKFYTQHGTNPARALVVSFYILLVFATFYFFFPSEWDIESKSKLIAKYRDFIEKNSKGYIKPFILLSWNVFISFLNALTLSLNSFTTLGFGNIPTSGFARYICILQGFLGWFLLSLFTVALINQAQL